MYHSASLCITHSHPLCVVVSHVSLCITLCFALCVARSVLGSLLTPLHARGEAVHDLALSVAAQVEIESKV